MTDDQEKEIEEYIKNPSKRFTKENTKYSRETLKINSS